jgi:hypothetical protein
MSTREARKKALFATNLKIAKKSATEVAGPSPRVLAQVDHYLHRQFNENPEVAQATFPETKTSVMVGKPAHR